MIILICDVCNFQLQVGSLRSFAILRDGKNLVWDVGPCCFDKPFTVPSTARPEDQPHRRAG